MKMDEETRKLNVEDIVQGFGGYLVRMLNCIEEFHAKHGHWPVRLRLPPGANSALRDRHLTALGYSMLTEKLHLVVSPDDEGPLLSEDSEGRTLNYSAGENWSGAELPKADLWLWRVSVY